ncbi:MAG: M28 family peptidase [Gammaproteobacteria bacterium]|nr:M28 family peptidase [Gammaproteobacteria bacterium]
MYSQPPYHLDNADNVQLVRHEQRPYQPRPRKGSHYLVALAAAVLALIIVTMTQAINQTSDAAQAEEIASLAVRLRAHVETLADSIGERNLAHFSALTEAADYIEQIWRNQGYSVTRHEHEIRSKKVANLEATRQGRSPEIVVVGAHYDSVFGSPGANDNGSGVAAMLELSGYLAKEQPQRTIRFVAFVNEEPPFFKTEAMGSRRYVKMARARGDVIRAMLCLETIGYYRDEPNSQRYPPPLGLFYPNTGNFIGFVSNLRSRALLGQVAAAFRAASDFPAERVATFGWIPGVDWSDHWSFWREGIPAVMITDTAPYRYPYYHTAEDKPDKVDYERLAQVVRGLTAVVRALAHPQ